MTKCPYPGDKTGWARVFDYHLKRGLLMPLVRNDSHCVILLKAHDKDLFNLISGIYTDGPQGMHWEYGPMYAGFMSFTTLLHKYGITQMKLATFFKDEADQKEYSKIDLGVKAVTILQNCTNAE